MHMGLHLLGMRGEARTQAQSVDELLPQLREEGGAMSDSVTNPAHYGGSIECRDALASRLEGTGLAPMAVYWLGCAFKYLWRFDRKNGVEDLRKCRQCIEFLIEEVEDA